MVFIMMVKVNSKFESTLLSKLESFLTAQNYSLEWKQNKKVFITIKLIITQFTNEQI